MMQAVVVIISEKKVSNNPEIIAPRMLPAAKVTPRRTIDVSIVPSSPVSNAPRTEHIQ